MNLQDIVGQTITEIYLSDDANSIKLVRRHMFLLKFAAIIMIVIVAAITVVTCPIIAQIVTMFVLGRMLGEFLAKEKEV